MVESLILGLKHKIKYQNQEWRPNRSTFTLINCSRYSRRSLIAIWHPITNYEKCYRATSDKEKLHKGYFEEIFNQYKGGISDGHQNDFWLKDAKNDVEVLFAKGEDHCTRRARIRLTDIYRRALSLASEAEKVHGTDHDDCALPPAFMLKLYRVFRASISDEKSKERLSACILSIEQELGVTPEKDPRAQQMPAFDLSSIGNVLGGLYQTFMTNPSIQKIKQDIQGKDASTIITKMSSLMHDPKIGEMAAGMMSSIGVPVQAGKQPSTIAEAVSSVVPGMDPKMLDLKGDGLASLLSSFSGFFKLPELNSKSSSTLPVPTPAANPSGNILDLDILTGDTPIKISAPLGSVPDPAPSVPVPSVPAPSTSSESSKTS
jgi:hypothetical protein